MCLTSDKAPGLFPDIGGARCRCWPPGVSCPPGADDPLVFGAGLPDGYETARGELGLAGRQLALARTSIQASGAPAPVITTAMPASVPGSARQAVTMVAPSKSVRSRGAPVYCA